MDEHLQKFSKIFIELAAIGVQVADVEKVGHLLCWLPDSFNGLVSIAGTMNWGYEQLLIEVKASIDRRFLNKTAEKPKKRTPITPKACKSISNTKVAGHGTKCYECYK